MVRTHLSFIFLGLFLQECLSRYPFNTDVCNTEECKKTAQRILDYMDPTVRPCDDFYRFACGHFLDNAQIRNDHTQNSSFTEVADKLQMQLENILFEPPQPYEPHPVRTMKKLIALCMDEKSIDARGLGPALAMMQRLGGWPVLQDGMQQKSDHGSWIFWELEVRQRKEAIGYGSLFRVGLAVDMKNNRNRVITIDQPGLGLGREYLVEGEDNPLVQAYYKYMVDIAVMYGADYYTAKRQLRKSLLFEIELAKITMPKENRRDFERMYNPYSMQQLMAEMGWMNWAKMLQQMMLVPLRRNEKVIVVEVEYFKKLEHFVNKFPDEVIANYMMWKTAKQIVPFSTTQMRAREMEFLKALVGTSTREPRRKTCVRMASSLSLALSSLYVKKFFDKKSKMAAEDMTERIRHEIIREFRRLDWMDCKTKQRSEFKASQIVQHIGYPAELEDPENIQNHYKGLKINQMHYMEAMSDVYRWINTNRLLQLRVPINKTDWRTHGKVTEVNAFYSPLENSMQFPAGILQQPFFSAKVPNYINYATIGLVMGHELTHGFDDQGSQFNYQGELEKWWDKQSKRNFDKKQKCIIDQYSGYKDRQTQLYLNGINTQGENVADNGGLKLSYRAYKRLARHLPRKPGLPGLQQYNQDQLFFLSYANLWCSRSRTAALKYQLTLDTHSSPEFRVNGPLKNMPEFSRIFRCRADDPMNPWKKCAVW